MCFSSMPNLFSFPFCHFWSIRTSVMNLAISVGPNYWNLLPSLYLFMIGTIFGVAPGCLLLPPLTIALVSFFNWSWCFYYMMVMASLSYMLAKMATLYYEPHVDIFFGKKHKCKCNWYLLVVFYGSCLIWLPFSVFLGGIVMSHYTISSTNPVITEVGNEGATTIEGAGEAHAAGKNKRRLRSFA